MNSINYVEWGFFFYQRKQDVTTRSLSLKPLKDWPKLPKNGGSKFSVRVRTSN